MTCTADTGHLPDSDHRWQECPSYDDEPEDTDPCNICGHYPCDCDDQYEAWKDRQWE